MQIHDHAVFLGVMNCIRSHVNTIPCLPHVKLIIQHKETMKYCLLLRGNRTITSQVRPLQYFTYCKMLAKCVLKK